MADLRIQEGDNNRTMRPLFTPLSDDYSPSISDRTRAGYFSQDCASQTERSDVINLKEMTNMVAILVQDLSVLKKSLYFARHVLEADYKTKLEERGLNLYCRVNDRIVDLEKMHAERVGTIRRSFKQQLSDALVRIATENERITQEMLSRNARLAQKRQNDELAKHDKGKLLQQQEAMIMMLKAQMAEQQERADRELEEAMMNRVTPSSFISTEERDELIAQISDLESKLDDMHGAMDDLTTENKQLVREVDDLSDQLDHEREVTGRLKRDLEKANEQLKRERREAAKQLEIQKADLEKDFENRMRRFREDFSASSKREFDEFRSKQMSKLKEQDLVNQRLLQEAMKKKEEDVIPDSDKDALIRRLQRSETKLKAEIARLQKEFERSNRTWDMKVTILKQSIHALKDEMFLRATLQKQAARLHHASVTYASDGPVIIPREPTPLNKRYRYFPADVAAEEKTGVIPEIIPVLPERLGNWNLQLNPVTVTPQACPVQRIVLT